MLEQHQIKSPVDTEKSERDLVKCYAFLHGALMPSSHYTTL